MRRDCTGNRGERNHLNKVHLCIFNVCRWTATWVLFVTPLDSAWLPPPLLILPDSSHLFPKELAKLVPFSVRFWAAATKCTATLLKPNPVDTSQRSTLIHTPISHGPLFSPTLPGTKLSRTVTVTASPCRILPPSFNTTAIHPDEMWHHNVY